MTLPASGQIGISDINVEIGQPSTYSSDLNFLNNLVKPAQRPAVPNLGGFYSKAYFQNNAEGNCDAGNCNCSSNCGNINCSQCSYGGSVNCINCDTQSWLQNNCNCACTYNCTWNQTSYACNCTCACSKIICTKLYQLGMMDYQIFIADQEYGNWLKKHDRVVYRGYIRWAKIVTAWIDEKGPDFMLWVPKEQRKQKQKESTTDWAYKIATPWSKHMAYLMGAVNTDDEVGRLLMKIGRPICKLVFMLPKKYELGLFGSYMMWVLCLGSYGLSSTYVNVKNKLSKSKNSLLNRFKLIYQGQ
jgi:hypothetical protein